MPNIKSAIKRTELAKEHTLKNRAEKSEMKTNLKKFDAAVEEGNAEKIAAAHKVAVKSVDKAAAKGLIHKNNAAHKKSAMASKLNG